MLLVLESSDELDANPLGCESTTYPNESRPKTPHIRALGTHLQLTTITNSHSILPWLVR